jgi:hypothetical protein
LLVFALGVVASLLMVIAEVTTLFDIDVVTASCTDLANPEETDTCHTLGGENHSFALVPVAILTAIMAVGAGLGGSRPAGFALIGAGVIVLAIALLGDLPDTNETGEIGENFESAKAVRGPALWLELAGGVLALGAGVLRLARPGGRD